MTILNDLPVDRQLWLESQLGNPQRYDAALRKLAQDGKLYGARLRDMPSFAEARQWALAREKARLSSLKENRR